MKVINKLLKVTPQEIEEVRRIYNKTAEDVKIDVQILKEWMSKQPHLPQNYDEGRLERMLLRNKFRIEKCKNQIDSYFTLRGMYPDFFQQQEFTLKGFEQIRKAIIYVPMPYINDTKERIVCTKYISEGADFFDMRLQFEYILALIDMELSHDYSVSTRFIMDLSNFKMAHVKAVDLNTGIKGFILYQMAYCARVSGIDWVFPPKYIDLIIPILKISMKGKMFSKITMHKDLTSLHNRVDKKYLPSNLGGDQKSMEDLHEVMEEMLKEEIEFLSTNAKLVSNENLRIGEPYKNDSFGLDGTFKKINLD